MRWLFWMPLVCSLATEQLQRDPTLDHPWELWKKTHDKQYQDKVDGVAPRAVYFCMVPCFLQPRMILGHAVLSRSSVQYFWPDTAMSRNKARSCHYGAHVPVVSVVTDREGKARMTGDLEDSGDTSLGM